MRSVGRPWHTGQEERRAGQQKQDAEGRSQAATAQGNRTQQEKTCHHGDLGPEEGGHVAWPAFSREGKQPDGDSGGGEQGPGQGAGKPPDGRRSARIVFRRLGHE